jgi:hypothetical protein
MNHPITLKLPLTGKPVLNSKPVVRTITMNGLKVTMDGVVYLQDVDGLWYKKLEDGSVEWVGFNVILR